MRAHGKGVGLSQVDAIRHSVLKEESFTEGLTFVSCMSICLRFRKINSRVLTDTKHGLQPPARRQVDMKAKSSLTHQHKMIH